MKLAIFLANAALCVCLAIPASAALMVHEPFNLPGSEAYLQGQPSGTGLTGNWQVEDGESHPTYGEGWKQRRLRTPLAYGDFEPTGYAVSSSDRAWHVWTDRVTARASMANPIASDQDSTVWLSFLYSHDQSYSGSTLVPMVGLEDSTNPGIRAGVHIVRQSDGQRRGVLGVTLGSSEVAGAFVGYEGSSLPAPEDQLPGLPEWLLKDDRTFFVLARFDFTSAGAWAYLNIYTDGQLPGEEPLNWQAWTWSEELAGGNLDTLLMGGSNANTFYDVDQIRIGTTMQSVLVPEPASLALLGLGGLAMLRRRR
jgi:PEP-CTERM motif